MPDCQGHRLQVQAGLGHLGQLRAVKLVGLVHDGAVLVPLGPVDPVFKDGHGHRMVER